MREETREEMREEMRKEMRSPAAQVGAHLATISIDRAPDAKSYLHNGKEMNINE